MTNRTRSTAVSLIDEQRRAWVRLTDIAITPEAAITAIQAFLEQAAPPGMKARHITPLHDGVLCSVEHGFGVDATLTIRVEPQHDRRLLNPDLIAIEPGDKREAATPCAVVATVSWSGTTRTLSEAAGSVFLYQQLIALGAAVEARFSHGTKVTRREVF